MELDQHMSFVEVVDCMKFVAPLLVPHKSPVQQKKVLLVYRRFVEQLLVPHKSLVEQMVAECKMFVELLLVLHTNLVGLRKQMLVVSCKMFVELQLVLHRSPVLEELLEEHCNQIVALLLALAVPRKSALAVVSILD